MSLTIVLVAGGKRDDVDLAGVKLFLDKHEAELYCMKINKEFESRKYWRRAEIVSEDCIYETAREGFYKHTDSLDG